MAIVIRHNGGNWPVDPRVPRTVQGTAVQILIISDIWKRKDPIRYSFPKKNDWSWNPGEIKVLEDTAEVLESVKNGQLRKYLDISVMTWIRDPVVLINAAGIQTVNHYLGRKPLVQLYDNITGQTIMVSAIHIDDNSFTVDVGIGPFNGYILYSEDI